MLTPRPCCNPRAQARPLRPAATITHANPPVLTPAMLRAAPRSDRCDRLLRKLHKAAVASGGEDVFLAAAMELEEGDSCFIIKRCVQGAGRVQLGILRQR